MDLDDLLHQSDVLSLHVRLSDETRGMIGRRELALMKEGALLRLYAQHLHMLIRWLLLMMARKMTQGVMLERLARLYYGTR